MKNKTQKNIRLCCYVALAFCIIYAIVMAVHFIGLLNGVNDIDWAQHHARKIGFFIIYVLSSFLMIGMWIKVVINILRGIKENSVFPQSNVRLLFWLALVFFVYILCWTNHVVLYQDNFVFEFQANNIIMPFFLLFFAFMYKVAADAVEENNLTI